MKKTFREKKITAEQEFLQAKQSLAEARIELRLAEQKLHALGFSEDYLAKLPSAPDASYTRYEITASLDGTVIGKHIDQSLPVDAFPDVTPVLVQVFTETEGLAAEEVEKYVTYPVEVAMNGLPRLKEIRSVSNFGLSVVNIYFEDGMDIYFARQLVNERLQEDREEIPEGFGEPEMGPITTGMGQILFYSWKMKQAGAPLKRSARSRTG